MSDRPVDSTWWQASDGRWYPPETKPVTPPTPPQWPPPTGGDSDRDRRRKRWLLLGAGGAVVVAIAVVAGVLLVGRDDAGPVSSDGAVSPSTTESAKSTTIPTTTERPPSTTSVQQAIDAVLEVNVESVGFDTDPTSLFVNAEFRNLSDRGIAAFQLIYVVTATDSLGRSYSQRLLLDCTEPPLGPGSARSGRYVVGQFDANIAGLENCTIGAWDMNPYIPEEAGLFSAVESGVVPTVVVEKTRVTFEDGSFIGTAAEGS